MQEQQLGLSELLEAGVHFGHQTRRWNPKMQKFIFTERNGIHIIDLRKTLDRLVVAKEAVREVVLAGERVLFVCTKRQLRSIIEQEAEQCGAFYVTERWLGGMLTNFQTIRKQIRRLKELERGQEESAFEFYTKKERLLLDRERLKLNKYLVGVKDMTRLPGAIFVVDVKREAIAVREADRLGIPVIAITDTNANPDLVEYPVPGNDDAIRSVGLITQAIGQSVREASAQVPEEQKRKVQDAQATTYSTETGEVTEAPSRPAAPRRKRVPRPGILEKLGGTSGAEAPAEDQKAEDEKAGDEKAGDQKAEDQKAEDQKAEDQKAEDQKAEDQKAEDQKAEDQKAEDQKAEDQKAGDQKAEDEDPKAKKVKAKKVKASSKEEEAAAEEGAANAEEATDAEVAVPAEAESGEAESGS